MGRLELRSSLRSAVAGAAAAGVWGLQEPLDQRVFGHDYSDVAVLGKAVTAGPGWWPTGIAIHLANGAFFGVAYHEVRRRTSTDSRKLALAMMNFKPERIPELRQRIIFTLLMLLV